MNAPTEIPAVRDADEVPAWFAYAGVVITVVPSFVALAYFQHRLLADQWGGGVPWPFTWSLACAVDLLGLVAGVYWLRSRRNRALRAWGRTTAVGAVVVSSALTVWALADTGPGMVLGLAPAFVVFLGSKLITGWQAERAVTGDALGQARAAVVAAQARAVAAERHAAQVTGGLLVALGARDAAHRAALDALQARLDTDTAGAQGPNPRLRAVPPAGPPVDPHDRGHVARVADWIRARRAADQPSGQRFAAEEFGTSKTRIADVHRAAVAVVDAESDTAAVG